MRRIASFFCCLFLLAVPAARASIFGQIRGIVHDAQHRPIHAAHITLHAVHSDLIFQTDTDDEGRFTLPTVPLGEYTMTVTDAGFASLQQTLTLASDTSPVLHFEMVPSTVEQTVSVREVPSDTNVNTATPTTLISREEIATTPGADRTNSMAMITSYVPGAYMTHDMLHMRGGHQVSWMIDGVQIPNTNISSNLGPQIDPKDIDYLEVQRGSYAAETGDRTYGVFNVVPRNGFERHREAELVLTAGSFLQTNAQINFGDHTEKLAYYASLNGNRTDYGLSTPTGRILHDAANGYGGFGSLIYNRSARDQFRAVAQLRSDFFQIPYDPDPNSFENQQFNSSGLRDTQHEVDGFTDASWLHTFNTSTVLQISPFVHYNFASYQPNPTDMPVATAVNRSSTYAGAQASLTTEVARNTLQVGLYSFGQQDNDRFGAAFHDGSGYSSFSIPDAASGGVVEAYVSDSYRATTWLTLIGGLRETRIQGQFTETATSPRVGAAVRLPKWNWVVRGFYGRFYQPPPLLTAAGPVVQFAQANNTDFQLLHGERDEEHQFGVQIPFRGWLLDADTFKTRVNNFLDHSNVGNSSIYFPVTVNGARVRAWELALRSPQLVHLGQAHLAYSNQIAEQRGNITGGLVCVPIGDPACNAGFTYRPVDHDQRNTLSIGFNATLLWRTTASANLNYGSGFVNGKPDLATPYPNTYLPEHTTFDLAVSKSIGERTTVSINALNLANRRVLLDNSLTFGGFHFNAPRELYGELRYRLHY